jgi:hypothetical protein
MFPIGVVLFSLGYAVVYYAVDVLSWVHSADHPHKQPPSFGFVLGLPGLRPFSAPINIEGASDPVQAFGGPTKQASSTTPAVATSPPAAAGSGGTVQA